MKAGLSTRSVYANIIILIVTMAISGCFPYVKSVKYTGTTPSAIKEGSTSRTKVINKFGLPIEETPDSRFLLYDYSNYTDLCFVPLKGNASCSFHFVKKGMVLLEFDNDNIVERYTVHVCKKPPDPICDQDDIYTMWTMINQLAGGDPASWLNVAAQYGQTLDEFRQAMELQGLEAVKRLIDDGADVNAKNGDGHTMLWTAVADNDVAIAKLLLSYGADVNPQNRYGRTLLHKAAWNGQVGVIELLLVNGADVNVLDPSGETPLHGAAQRPSLEGAAELLANGADVNARDSRGSTPLHAAVGSADISVISLLLAKGADVNAGTKGQVKRPVKIARDLGGREDIIELLKLHGGKE